MKPFLLSCLFAIASGIASAQQQETTTPTDGVSISTKSLSDEDVRQRFYRADQVQTIQLHVAEEEMHKLLEALPKRIYVPATFQWRDISKQVAVRFKGNSSSQPKQQHKRSFLVRFDKYEPEARFFGLRRVSFDNGIQFGSLFSEPIITEILRQREIKTHRCNYAKLFLNGQYKGVYVNVERIDESFIENHLSNKKGALFKVDGGGPGCNLQLVSEQPAIYARTFEAKNASAKKQTAALVELIKLINRTPDKDFAAMLKDKIELNEFLHLTAVMLFSGAFDQLTGWNPHNYYLFHDLERDRWRYLPWDLDVGFSEIAFGRIQVLTDWNAAWPVAPSGRPNPLMERIMADPTLLEEYRNSARKILNEQFQPERLCALVDEKHELIRDDLRTDPFPHRRVTNPGDRSYDDIVESIKTFVRKRHRLAIEQLESPGPRPTIVYRPQGSEELHRRLHKKMQLIQQGARQRQQKGQDMSELHRIMQTRRPADATRESGRSGKIDR